MKKRKNKGSVVAEFVLLFPLLLTLLWGFLFLIRATLHKQQLLEKKERLHWKNLTREQKRLPVSARPCLVDPEICIKI